MKRTRILTNREFPNEGDHELIEVDEHGTFYWRAVEGGTEVCFPVDEEFVKEKFFQLGREYKCPTSLKLETRINGPE